MRNRLLMGVTVAALTFAAVPATAQVTVPRNDEPGWDGSRNPANDEGYRPDEDDAPGYDAADDNGNRSFGFGIQVQGGGSANEYGPYGYAERGYGVYAQWGYRDRDRDRRPFSLRAAFDHGRREGYREGFDAARDGRWDWRDHRYYRSTRGYDRRFGGRDAYDLNYRNGFRSGYEEGYRDGRGRRGRGRGRW